MCVDSFTTYVLREQVKLPETAINARKFLTVYLIILEILDKILARKFGNSCDNSYYT